MAQFPDVVWLEPEATGFGVPVLDVRSVTHGLVAVSQNKECAQNAVSFGNEDGLVFVGKEPVATRVLDLALSYPLDGALHDGVLFAPSAMEDKWALFYHRGFVIVVRSWLRTVSAVVRGEVRGDRLHLTEMRGSLSVDDPEPALDVRCLDFLMRSHALGEVMPAPLTPAQAADPDGAALWCMSLFGRQAICATHHAPRCSEPARPLRTQSLLHIAIARGQAETVARLLAEGWPPALVAADGLATLHWAGIHDDPAIADLLLKAGCPVDVRSLQGATPLMNSVQARQPARARRLLDLGADPDARDHRGFTALHRAAEMAQADMVELLLARGADPEPEAAGHTPRSLATSRGAVAILALLDRNP